MKKILRIVLSSALAAMMMIGTAFAADTVLLEGTNGEVTDAVNSAPDGAVIVCTVKYDPENANNGETMGNGWGIGGIVTDGSWCVGSDFQATYSSDGEFSLEPGEIKTFTFDVAAVKRAATGEIQINFYNGWILQKAVIRTMDVGSDGSAKTVSTTAIVLLAVIALAAVVAVLVMKKARSGKGKQEAESRRK